MNKDIIKENDIDLMGVLKALWFNKLLIFCVVTLFSLAGLYKVLKMPDVYTSTAILATEKDADISLPGSLGALSGLAGVSSGGGASNRVETTLKLLESKSFISEFLTSNGYVVDIFAVKSWSLENEELIYVDDLYSDGKWLREKTLLKTSEPTSRELTDFFLSNNLSFKFDSDSGFLQISISHYSPFFAKEVLDKLIKHINFKAREKAISDSEKKIAYLNNAIKGANDNSLKSVFNSMIVEEEKERMLATVKSDFLFSVIEPATVPDIKSGPKRLLLLVGFVFFGVFVSFLVVIVKVFFFDKSRS